jgi:hypothetical protein
MEDLKLEKTQGFENLFVISSTSILALLTLIFTSAISALFVLILSFPLSFIIYKNYGNLIDSFLFEKGLTSKSANELAVAYLFAQGLVVGTIFGWIFGRAYFG